MFVGCGFTGAAAAYQGPARKHQPVMIGGRRVPTIDLHCHIGVNDIWNVILFLYDFTGVRPRAGGGEVKTQ